MGLLIFKSYDKFRKCMEESPTNYEELLNQLEDQISSLIIDLDITLAKIDERRPNKNAKTKS